MGAGAIGGAERPVAVPPSQSVDAAFAEVVQLIRAARQNAAQVVNAALIDLYWRVGQYTTIAGYEQVAEGPIHFAGEHTQPAQQGFLDGAVVSGERVAAELMAFRHP